MSAKYEAHVWQHSPLKGDAFVVHLALGDIANDIYGGRLWMTHATLAAKAHTSVSTVKRTLHQLIDAGFLELIEEGGGRGVASEYQMILKTVHREPFSTIENGSSVIENGSSVIENGSSVIPPPLTNSRELKRTEDLARTEAVSLLGKPLRPFEREFEEAWREYPRKLAKQAAYRAFVTRLRSGVSLEELVQATRHYAKARSGEDPAYTLHGSTFYGPSERWRDYLDGIPELPPQPKRHPMTGRHAESLDELAARVAAPHQRPPEGRRSPANAVPVLPGQLALETPQIDLEHILHRIPEEGTPR